LDPTWIPVTQDRARLADANAEYRAALKSDAVPAYAYAALGQALLNQGEFRAALETTRQASQHSDKEPPYQYHLSDRERDGLARLLKRCQRNVELAASLTSILDGSIVPSDAKESLEFAQLCDAKGLNGAAARMYLRAFDADPAMAADQKAGHRYRAACAAALAGAASPGDPTWRRQSRRWLRSDLELCSNRLKAGSRPDAVETYFMLSHWLNDPALISVRDQDRFRYPSGDEAEECHRLWTDVRTIRDRAENMVNQ
jgi:tetratricopeptide (TPR) repeat protein